MVQWLSPLHSFQWHGYGRWITQEVRASHRPRSTSMAHVCNPRWAIFIAATKLIQLSSIIVPPDGCLQKRTFLDALAWSSYRHFYISENSDFVSWETLAFAPTQNQICFQMKTLGCSHKWGSSRAINQSETSHLMKHLSFKTCFTRTQQTPKQHSTKFAIHHDHNFWFKIRAVVANVNLAAQAGGGQRGVWERE